VKKKRSKKIGPAALQKEKIKELVEEAQFDDKIVPNLGSPIQNREKILENKRLTKDFK
jgi:hypothetical protein